MSLKERSSSCTLSFHVIGEACKQVAKKARPGEPRSAATPGSACKCYLQDLLTWSDSGSTARGKVPLNPVALKSSRSSAAGSLKSESIGPNGLPPKSSSIKCSGRESGMPPEILFPKKDNTFSPGGSCRGGCQRW